jgi:hypothetical protein
MMTFREGPLPPERGLVTVAVGGDLEDALSQFGDVEDCIGCSTAVAAPRWTTDGAIDRVLGTFSPLAARGPIVKPFSGAGALLRRGSHWTAVDIDAGAQRLRTVRMPADLVGTQRLLAVNDLRGLSDPRPPIAIGLWALFAHPVVRMGARFAGARDGLTAEVALAVHPDRYVLIDSSRPAGLTVVVATPDPIAADLVLLALRQLRIKHRGPGPWEDPLVQVATELDLGVRSAEAIDIDAFVSPTLSSEQHERAAVQLTAAAELIGVRTVD